MNAPFWFPSWIELISDVVSFLKFLSSIFKWVKVWKMQDVYILQGYKYNWHIRNLSVEARGVRIWDKKWCWILYHLGGNNSCNILTQLPNSVPYSNLSRYKNKCLENLVFLCIVLFYEKTTFVFRFEACLIDSQFLYSKRFTEF